MNRSPILFEENPNGNEKKKRKFFEIDANNYEASFLPNYLNQFNNDQMISNQIGSNDARYIQHTCNINNPADDHIYRNICNESNNLSTCSTDNSLINPYKQNNTKNVVLNTINSYNKNIQFDKSILINSIDVLLNFMNYNNLNETINHEILHENLLNLRFHILSLNDDKFNQKKITEYFIKM
ncbi:conserved Plasmodium protein, unknown function [Plasmodium berghei]|uniref:Uncharacterized protein n=2 Tax=Plasmodium berghei TaxID=5821 RepID=A0A509ATJ8_PLABA|nr:conserved Plasmodium protein, unknown function [Plasmodium berghei ANKA]CXJ04411.1 conserved Plasmodium protein, unknown function [Plasmodium berghei]SCL98658.1 conserved Plasmodium protein, unknown function [Plasmodium berghei]SCM16871.1 conserved Plasmodium protein, unknown function [Plasmodium berghei]SCM18669.1 conserved Plasmodium protein, unknown function [Plasmodium berghei]SCN28104.1 conserved Plasmodium protein, unknown function [Plasmodium berghei]|eukprot:XP_034423754.1 conserved Plasmodium protein, unknown function [Plasmodium berghei ANKA]